MIDRSLRILIADQSLCFLELFQLHISTQPRINAVDIATSLSSIEKQLSAHSYDLVIIGEELSDASLLSASHNVREKYPTIKLAAFCRTFNRGVLLHHNLNILHNLISKRESLSSVMLAIYRICNGDNYITPHIHHLVRIDEKNNLVPTTESPLSQLSPRQVKVLTLLANGLSVKEVAKELHLSPKSVDSHKYRLMLKLQIKDRVELARFAIREGLVDA